MPAPFAVILALQIAVVVAPSTLAASGVSKVWVLFVKARATLEKYVCSLGFAIFEAGSFDAVFHRRGHGENVDHLGGEAEESGGLHDEW